MFVPSRVEISKDKRFESLIHAGRSAECCPNLDKHMDRGVRGCILWAIHVPYRRSLAPPASSIIFSASAFRLCLSNLVAFAKQDSLFSLTFQPRREHWSMAPADLFIKLLISIYYAFPREFKCSLAAGTSETMAEFLAFQYFDQITC